MTDQQRCKNTEELLHKIANRLSGRDNLRTTNYIVDISENGSVTMQPVVYVFPNRYRRCDSDKLDTITYVLNHCMEHVSKESFVPGQYTYQSSIDKKRRQWTRTQ